jgi:hypothetical protein
MYRVVQEDSEALNPLGWKVANNNRVGVAMPGFARISFNRCRIGVDTRKMSNKALPIWSRNRRWRSPASGDETWAPWSVWTHSWCFDTSPNVQLRPFTLERRSSTHPLALAYKSAALSYINDMSLSALWLLSISVSWAAFSSCRSSWTTI